jgi:hypothetical protein
MDDARRRRHERLSRAHDPGRWSHDSAAAEHWPELHAAIERLPAKYRDPIVLCYLEGLTHEQAASQLRWPLGTVKTRLTRGRERLRRRLSGLDRSCPAILPSGLLRSTTTAVLRDAARHEAAGAASPTVMTITEGILKMMWIGRLRLTIITLVALIAAAGFGASIVAQQVSEKGHASVEPGAPVQTNDKPGSSQVLEVSATTQFDPATVTIVRSQFDGRVDKVFVDLGSAVKKGDPLLELLIGKVPNKDLFQKAKMILRSRSDGIVIKRSVVVGNYYDAKDELMQIAALDHLWVQGRVSEKVAGKITLGQRLRVVAPFTKEEFHGRLEWIDNQIDSSTRSMVIRTSIPSPDHRLKAGMFVRVLLELPPTSSQAIEPRDVSNRSPRSNVQQRLENLKPKIDLLLKARADRTASTTFGAHLGALEQELELLVREAEAK